MEWELENGEEIGEENGEEICKSIHLLQLMHVPDVADSEVFIWRCSLQPHHLTNIFLANFTFLRKRG